MMNFLRVMEPIQKAKLIALSMICIMTLASNSTFAFNPPPPGVEMDYFRTKIRNGNSVLLSWVTNSETMNVSFRVMMSRNSNDFTEIARIPGFGTTTEPQSYQFTHDEVLPGRTYYRLMQENEGGRMTQVAAELVIIGRDNIGIIVSPNPAIGIMSVETEFPLTTNIQLMNMSGQLIKEIQPQQANNIQVGDLPRGLYILMTEYGAKKLQLQ